MTISHPGNRPYEEPNSFVGRSRELGELRDSALVVRELTLCGAGGIGKTRLALRLLAQLAADFPDGAFFVELGDLRKPELVVSRVASVIGVDEEPGRPLIDTLADALRPRRLLLALDNCEHLIDECASLCQRLLASAPALQIIATSREPLRVAAEAVCQVPPLALPPPGLPGSAELADYDALRLFADRAAAAAPGFTLSPDNAATVAAVCRALDGLPLAIELAAAWVRVLSVEQISARLHDRFQLLSSGDRTAPERQRGLRATIDWSHDLLAPLEQVLLRRLSIFAGWSLEMAEEVCSDDDLPRAQVLDLLTALADKSLIEVEPEVVGQARYRMLETIRDYAATRLAEAGETAVIERRMRDYTVREVERLLLVGMALTEAPWSARQDVFRRFDAESGNMRLVLSRCLASGDAETGLRICSAMRPVWIVRGYFAEGAEWFDGFLALGGSGFPASVRGRPWPGGRSWPWPATRRKRRHWRRRGSSCAGRRARNSGRQRRSTCSPRPRCTPGGPTMPRPTPARPWPSPGMPATGGTRAMRSVPRRPWQRAGAACTRRSSWPRPRWRSCATSISSGGWPGPCSAWLTWPG